MVCFWVRSKLATEQLLLQAVPCSCRRSNEDHKLHRTERAICPRCMTRIFRGWANRRGMHTEAARRCLYRASWRSANVAQLERVCAPPQE